MCQWAGGQAFKRQSKKLSVWNACPLGFLWRWSTVLFRSIRTKCWIFSLSKNLRKSEKSRKF
jgi:hypothetical protein